MLGLEAITSIRQKLFYERTKAKRPPHGIIFPEIRRKDADAGVLQCCKFLANFGFYKFGREVSFFPTVCR